METNIPFFSWHSSILPACIMFTFFSFCGQVCNNKYTYTCWQTFLGWYQWESNTGLLCWTHTSTPTTCLCKISRSSLCVHVQESNRVKLVTISQTVLILGWLTTSISIVLCWHQTSYVSGKYHNVAQFVVGRGLAYVVPVARFLRLLYHALNIHAE